MRDSGSTGGPDWRSLSVLVTGGTGSFGRAFTRLVMSELAPKRLIIFSRDELKQHEMRREFPDGDGSPVRYFIGDIRDRERLRRALEGVDVVVHAAALKQVPACEYNPIEAIRTNISGAVNIVDVALDCGVERVIALSTDKAVQPANLYGATKLVAERLFVQANSYSGKEKTRFSVVRYGNVFGSRGSVVPLFLQQRASKLVTITDERMTRFWISLDQGVRLVLMGLELMQGGEIIVPKLPALKVTDLAKAIAPEAEISITGIRPGEKLHETLITEEEARHAREYETHFVIEPEHPFWGKAPDNGGVSLPEGFTYRSDRSTTVLGAEALREMMSDSGCQE